MNIRATANRVITYLNDNKWTIASRIGGGLTAAYVLSNANYSGKKDSAVNVKVKQADRMTGAYFNSRRLSDRNKLTSKLKDTVFRTNADWSLPDKFNAVTGYLKGAFEQIANDVVPACLATGALLASKKYAKYFGAGLAVWAVKYLVCDVLDIGRKNPLKF